MGYKLADDVTLESADGTYVFLKENGDAAVPDYIGGMITQHLLTNELNTCIEYITENYDVEPDDVRKDIKEFVVELEKRGLVEKFDE